MRGALRGDTGQRNGGGIIPADAGSTNAAILTIPGNRDHPRGCGEHAPSRPLCPVIWGSSPRMRGAPLRSWHSHITDRIIPADAGSTCLLNPSFPIIWDHPRGCGEHVVFPVFRIVVPGSSPRMRGAPNGCNVQMENSRIIPADAGSTNTWEAHEAPAADHPRGCGEHDALSDMVGCDGGSSPRMRGAHFFNISY